MRYLLLAVLLLPVCACRSERRDDGLDTGAGGSGEPAAAPLLDPFQGKWLFDLERTLAAWEAEGVPAEQVDQARAFYGDAGQSRLSSQLKQSLESQGIDSRAAPESLGRMHQDITIQGPRAIGTGMVSIQYDFFALHQHDGTVCGKAWHHEDRHDPGDMSKCLVKLALLSGELHLQVKMKEGLPGLNDPDLVGTPPIVLDSASGCVADQPTGPDWSRWITYVFVRPPGPQ